MLIIKENKVKYKEYRPSERLRNLVKEILRNPNLEVFWLKERNKVYCKLIGFDIWNTSEINRIIPLSDILKNR